jgi:hypothetical protein
LIVGRASRAWREFLVKSIELGLKGRIVRRFFIRSALLVELVGFDQGDAGGVILASDDCGVGSRQEIMRMADSRSLVGDNPVAAISACCVSFQSSFETMRTPKPS